MRGHARVEGAPVGSPYRRAQVAVSVQGVCPLVEARTRRAMTGRKRRGRMCKARTRQALTGGKGRGRVGPGANSSCKNSNGRDHRDWARTGVGTHTTTTMRTRVRARTDGHQARVRMGAGWNGHRRYAGARGYEHGGINKTPTDFVFAKLFIRISSLSQHA
jgi:hypothetical protein